MKTTTEETIQFLDQIIRLVTKYKEHLQDVANPSGDVPDDWDFIHGVPERREAIEPTEK